MRSLAVTAVSLVSALGDGTDAALAALRDRHGALRPCALPDEGLVEGAGGYVGCVGNAEAGIVTGGLSRFDCRNNRLARIGLAQEPGRLWKRYLVTNAQFLYLMSREILVSSSGD